MTDQQGVRRLDSAGLLDAILMALEHKQALSIVSVGQTEAFVMAQYTIYTEEEFMSSREAYNANRGEKSGFFHRGIRFPNVAARDDAVVAARKADIVGYNLIEPWAREFTEKVFATYELTPRLVFEANIRRVFMFSQKDKFERMLQGRRILLVGSLAPQACTALDRKLKEKLNMDIVGAISIYEYEDIPRVKDELNQYDFDLCLLAAGVNALILAPYIATHYGKVAFDIGWGMKSFITDEVETDSFITEVIGLVNLYKL